MKWNKVKNTSSSPSSAIGIMKFNESIGKNKISPQAVVGFTIAFIVLIVILKVLA